MVEPTPTMVKALRIIDQWAGDLSPDFEDEIGAHGAAADAVIDGLVRRGLVIVGAWGTYPLTPAGQAAIRHR
jgi:hypothetical protein